MTSWKPQQLEPHKELIIAKVGIALVDKNDVARKAACKLLIKVEKEWPGTGDVLGKMHDAVWVCLISVANSLTAVVM